MDQETAAAEYRAMLAAQGKQETPMSLEFLGRTSPEQDAALMRSIDALNLPDAHPDLDRIAAYCAAAPAGPWEAAVEQWPRVTGGTAETGTVRAADSGADDSPLALLIQHCPAHTGMPEARAFAAQARTDLPALVDYCRRLEAAIRKHRDMRGDDRCYQDDAALYAALPEGDTRPATETAVTLENCARYILCRQQGQEYVSPQRRIEELEAENARLQAELSRTVDKLVDLDAKVSAGWARTNEALALENGRLRAELQAAWGKEDPTPLDTLEGD